MKNKLFALLTIAIMNSTSSWACMGGSYEIQIPEYGKCVLNADGISCGGKSLPMMYIDDIGDMSDMKFADIRYQQWGTIQLMYNTNQRRANNPNGLKWVALGSLDDANIFSIFELYENNQRKVIKLESNRAPGGGAYRSFSPAANKGAGKIYGISYDADIGC